ncbi:MAG: hypothetical protein AAFR96_05500 [Planctomycetota bacterium]
MRTFLALQIACVCAATSAGQTVDPPPQPGSGDAVTDFGFWSGSWLVQVVRKDLENAVYVDNGTARATVERVAGGDVLLERWEGETGASADAFGLSLTYFDPAIERWVAVRSFPGGEPLAVQFGRIEGVFEEDMIPFHPPRVHQGGQFEIERFHSTRSVFSDISSDEFRWFFQFPRLEYTWETVRAMTHSRIGETPAGLSPLRIDRVPEACACEGDDPRLLDWLVGAWSGEGVSVRVSSVLRGCGVVADVRMERDGSPVSAVLAVAWDESSNTWQAREVGLNRPLGSLVWEAVGRVTAQGIALRSMGVDDLGGMVFQRLEGGGMRLDMTLPDGRRLDAELEKL